jgi:ATP diphosphatase
MAEEEDKFDFGAVVESITRKLLRRHPHVFGEARGLSPEAVEGLWHRIKEEEKAERAAVRSDATSERTGALAGVPGALPALARALKLQEKASRVGFDWNDPEAVLDKIREETEEVAQAIAEGDKAHAVAEVGDLLFVVINLARHLGTDPERALRETNLKFERRFGAIERALAQQGRVPEQASLAEMDALWDEAKAEERMSQRQGGKR